MASSSSSHRHSRQIHVPGSINMRPVPPPQPTSSQRDNVTSSPGHLPLPPQPQTVTPQMAQSPGYAPADPAQLAQMHSNLARQVGNLLGRVQSLQQNFDLLKKQETEKAATEVNQLRSQAQGMQREESGKLAVQFNTKLEQASHGVVESATRLVPGVLGCQIQELGSVFGERGNYSPYIRVGSLDLESVSVPGVIPFVGLRNWLLEGSAKTNHQIILNVLSRLICHFPLKHLRILVFDPHITGALGALSPLRSINGETFPPVFTNSEDFVAALEKGIQIASRNAERMAVQQAKSLVELWNNSQIPEGILTVAVVLDYPYNVSEKLSQTIRRALEIGPNAGLALIVQKNTSASGDAGNETDSVIEQLMRIRTDSNKVSCEFFEQAGVSVTMDEAIDANVIGQIMNLVSDATLSQTGPTYPLEDLIAPALENFWQKDASESLDALIGKAGTQDLVVSFRSENPPLPNMLVGGAVGQGKSNLLLDIIFSLTTQYSPDELELLLLDFKRGLEFKRFDKNEAGEGWLPHAKILSLESNQEFGMATLRYIRTELNRRSQIYKEVGANSIDEFRRAGGKIPRILVIIDEFQILFDGEGDEVQEAVDLLNEVAKQGRAFGVHLILASQTISGITGLRVKGDSIFAQFPMRMSLKNTEQESQAILSQGNKAAAELTYRGEVIFNKNLGQDPDRSNIRGIAAWVKSDVFEKIQYEMWKKGHNEPPMVFIGSAYASWDAEQIATLQPRKDQMVEAWIGRPIAISNEPFKFELDTDTNQGIALVGTGDEEAYATLISSTATMVKTLGIGAKVVFMCGLNAMPDSLSAFAQNLEAKGFPVEIVNRREIPEYLVRKVGPVLESEVEDPTVYIGLGMQRIPGMEKVISPTDTDGNDFAGTSDTTDDFAEISFDFSGNFNAVMNTGKEVLVRLASQGALQKMYLMGWWSSLQGVTDLFGIQRKGIGKYLLLKVGVDDVRELGGALAKITSDHPRVTAYDTGSDEGLISVVPFESLPIDFWSK